MPVIVYAVTVEPDPIVAVADVRAYGGVPAAVTDAQITGFIAAAIGFLDGPGEWLNRSLGEQTITATLATSLYTPLRPRLVPLAAGPVLDLVSVTGISGGDSFGAPPCELDGDAVRLFQPCGPTSGGAPTPIVITYQAGSPPGVIAQIVPVICMMVAKQAAAAPASGRDPSLRSENIPDTFSRTYGTGGAAGGMGAFDASTLAPIAHLRRW